MLIRAGLIFGCLIASACLAPGAHADEFEDLGQADISSASQHCWIPVQGGRIGVSAGTMPALIAETNRKAFTDNGMEPSIGKRIYAGTIFVGPEPALMAGIDGDKVTVVMPLTLVGALFIEPFMPITLYPTANRQPAITPRVWTGGLTRPKLVAMMDCYDNLQGG